MNNKILVFATHDFGGAGESAYRITKAIRQLGYEAGLIVKHKTKPEPFVVKAEEKVNHTPISERVYRKVISKLSPKHEKKPFVVDRNYYFFNLDEAKASTSTSALINALPFNPDIILLAWISDFINSETAFQLQKHTGAKVYWLMTDMAPITGGCHYAWDCKGYTVDCSNCPAILSNEFKDRAKHNFLIKKNNISQGGFKVIAGSGWTHKQASESTLFKSQKNIPTLNGLIDFFLFNNSKRDIAKKVFDISVDSKVIFSGATYSGEKRKGISTFVESLAKLYNQLPAELKVKTKVLIAGNNLQDNDFVNQIPFEVVAIDFIKDNRLLSLAYQAADVYVCPSLEDSGPMMVNEALACGTPVVGFEMGLLYNMVQDGVNGYKVALGDSAALAIAMNNVLSLSDSQFQIFSANAVKTVEEYASLEALKKVMLQITTDL